MIGPAAAERAARNRPIEEYNLLTDIRMDHPVFQPFNNPHSGSFSSARFFDHARVSAGPGAEIAARFDNGDPALISINFNKGRVLIFASSADDASNDLPLKSVYAPFWQQMLRYLESFREQRHWLDVGDIIYSKRLLVETALRQAKGNSDLSEAIVILDPGKRRLAAAQGSNDIEAEQAGFYEIRAMNLSVPVAVNAAPGESDLTHGNAEEMAAGWMSSKPAVFSQDERPTPEEQDRNQHFWTFLLLGAVLFLIAESLLSNYELRMTNDEWKHTESMQRDVFFNS
jgi:hypothetical protein